MSLGDQSRKGSTSVVLNLLGSMAGAAKNIVTSANKAGPLSHDLATIVDDLKSIEPKPRKKLISDLDQDGNTLMHCAVLARQQGIVKQLLELGADVDARNENGCTPLHLAADQGDVEMLALLQEQGADLTAKDKDKWMPLYYAANKNHVAAVSLLLQYKEVQVDEVAKWLANKHSDVVTLFARAAKQEVGSAEKNPPSLEEWRFKGKSID